MSVRVAVNGFGRIGRNVVRAAKASGADVEFVAVKGQSLDEGRVVGEADKGDAAVLLVNAWVRVDRGLGKEIERIRERWLGNEDKKKRIMERGLRREN